MLNAICGWIYRQADLVMVPSDGFQKTIAHFGVDNDRIVTLPNSAPESFAPVSPAAVPERIRSLIPAGRRLLMFAGNIGESQDFDTIVAAAKLLPPDCDVLIAVVGSGRDEDRVRALVSAQGLDDRFLFLGRHPEPDMPLFFACADLMLVSLRDEAIFALTIPSKIQAYMACGKPILASLAGEGSAVIDAAGIGLTVSPGDPVELSRAMVRATSMTNAELRDMGTKARELYEQRFSLGAVVSNLTRHLQAVLAAMRKPQ
jgi:glycosyltransferase involved in cell wall biosynthesis